MSWESFDVALLCVLRNFNASIGNKIMGPKNFIFCTGCNQLTKLLIQKGANVNLADKKGTSPLQLVARNGDSECVDLMIKHGANVNQKVEDNKTALDFATDETSKLTYSSNV